MNKFFKYTGILFLSILGIILGIIGFFILIGIILWWRDDFQEYPYKYFGDYDAAYKKVEAECPKIPFIVPRKIPLPSSFFEGFGTNIIVSGCPHAYQVYIHPRTIISGSNSFVAFIVDKKINFNGVGQGVAFFGNNKLKSVEEIQFENGVKANLIELNDGGGTDTALSFPYKEHIVTIIINSNDKDWLIELAKSIIGFDLTIN